jgi:molybdenum cofactor synthesis domain-containing protein
MIEARLAELADTDAYHAIWTTGGTGPAPRDVTPEATKAVIERDFPGLADRMRAEGQKITPYAALSRGVSGIRSATLIVNLPGSPKGAVESMDAILDLIPTIMNLLRPGTD